MTTDLHLQTMGDGDTIWAIYVNKAKWQINICLVTVGGGSFFED